MHNAILETDGLLVIQQNAIGDGGLYTIWAGVQVAIVAMTILVMYRGAQWRAAAEAKAARRRAEKDAAGVAAETANDKKPPIFDASAKDASAP